MTWDPVWEKIFRDRAEWGKYPPEELIRFIAKNYYPVKDRRTVKVLEVGCGPGAGPSWYIAREGFSLYGIDGSETAIEKAKKRFREEGLAGEFMPGSLDRIPWSEQFFDCVIDVACLQHNDEEAARGIMREIYRVLKPGGRHFSLTVKNDCWGDGSGDRVDATSYRDLKEGPFAAMGVTRFATKESLRSLYADFTELEINYSIRSMNNGTKEIANWIVTCSK